MSGSNARDGSVKITLLLVAGFPPETDCQPPTAVSKVFIAVEMDLFQLSSIWSLIPKQLCTELVVGIREV